MLVSGPATIPFTGPGGRATLQVTGIQADGIDIRLTLPNGGVVDRVAVGCALTYGLKGSGSFCGRRSEAGTLLAGTTGFTRELTAVRHGTALIEMSRD